MILTTDYSQTVFNSPAKFASIVNKAARTVKRLRKKYPDLAIAFRGQSGSALAYPLSFKLKIPIILVRKETENCHTRLKVEGGYWNNSLHYLIVDDFISSGNTVKTIRTEVDAITVNDGKIKCVGILLYNSSHAFRKFDGLQIYRVKV